MEDTDILENEDEVIVLDSVKDKDFIEKWGLETDGIPELDLDTDD